MQLTLQFDSTEANRIRDYISTPLYKRLCALLKVLTIRRSTPDVALALTLELAEATSAGTIRLICNILQRGEIAELPPVDSTGLEDLPEKVRDAVAPYAVLLDTVTEPVAVLIRCHVAYVALGEIHTEEILFNQPTSVGKGKRTFLLDLAPAEDEEDPHHGECHCGHH